MSTGTDYFRRPEGGRPPVNIETIRNAWIPMPDGCSLSARIWRPTDAAERPVPAIVEYIPYRKNDATAHRDATMHPVFAAAGYASVRVDMRGSGDSDGIPPDEYAPVEQRDAVQILQWLAEQPWCTGDVGIMGKSWGGFNGLQIAALRPPQLKAVVTVCSTDDRYADDVHYTGGSLIASEMLPWASTMLAYNARPPDPDVVGETWREQWFERIDRTPAYIETWLAHQRRDAYWKHASICEDFGAVQTPVLAIGGLSDPYRGAIFRLLENLRSPVRALLGPWAHNYPHQGVPGPAADFLTEAIRWWDHWLLGLDSGAMDEPALRVWMPDGVPPGTDYQIRPGRWVTEPSWPGSRNRHQVQAWSDGHESGPRAMRSDLPIGSAAGSWLQFGDPADQPADQRADDALSWCVTWPALEQAVEIVGVPLVRLTVAADQPVAQVAVRLCDVGPDGSSRFVTAGLWNLTHDATHETAQDLESGSPCSADVPLVATSYRFPPGHQIRVSVSACYWPWAWPSPTVTTVTVDPAPAGGLLLPIREQTDDAAVTMPGPLPAPPTQIEESSGVASRAIRRDPVLGDTETVLTRDEGGVIDHLDGLTYCSSSEDRFSLRDADPTSATVRCDRSVSVSRGQWRTRVETRSVMTADAANFLVTNHLSAFENDALVRTRQWTAIIGRDHV